MGRKIFISYKYADSKVLRLPNTPVWEKTTVRDYVDLLQNLIESTDKQRRK